MTGLSSSIWATDGSRSPSNAISTRSTPPPSIISVPEKTNGASNVHGNGHSLSRSTSKARNRSSSPLKKHQQQNRTAAHTPAPAPAPPPIPSRTSLPPSQALHRLEQTCLRLRWKALDLDASYNRAQNAASFGFDPLVAEQNFKVDFYEFYSWIEQAIVLLQRVFGVEVSSSDSSESCGGPRGATRHTYHHDVLRSLSEGEGPLRGVLGGGEVNHALWKAKELRNRWKDVQGGGETVPLGMYDLSWILGKILGGLDGAYVVAREKVKGGNKVMSWADEMNGDEVDDKRVEEEEEEGWDWMVEAMDWEAS